MMILQCEAEMGVRCLYRLEGEDGRVDCPNTLVMDKETRKKGWDDLKKAAEKNGIALDNVNSANIAIITCPHDNRYDQELRFMKALGLEKKDLVEQ